MKANRMIAGVAALLMGAAAPAFFIDTDIVSCEKVYDVRLSAETVEIDINDIPENREVLVGVNLDNNPGVIGLTFLLRKDPRLGCDTIQAFELVGEKCGVNHSFHDNGNVLEVSLLPNIDYNNGELFFDNGQFIKFKLILPNEINPGDFFEVTPILDYSNDKEAYFYRANDFSSFFGRENFSSPVAGGIRITGKKNEPEPSKQPEPEPSPSPEQKPSDQQAGNNSPQPGSDNNSENRQETQAVTSVVSETVSTSVSETVNTSVITSETSALISETMVTSVSETEVTDETTSVSETAVTEAVSEENHENKNRSKYLWGAAMVAAFFAGIGAYNIRHNKNNKEN